MPGTREKPDIEPLYQSAKQHLWLKLVLDLYAEFLMASCNQLQGKAFLWSLSCPHHPVLSMTWLSPHVTQESIKALASLTREMPCCDIFDQVVYAYYQSTYLSAWLQAPHLSPPHRPWPWAAMRTAPFDHCLRRGAATCCPSAIAENRLQPHRKQVTATYAFFIPLDFKSESYYPWDRDDNGRSNQCLCSRQVTLAWGAVHSSIKRLWCCNPCLRRTA